MADDLTNKILADYPTLAFLLNDPEVGPLLLEAVAPDSGLSPAAFQAKLAQTNWWKTSSAAQRNWETLAATDPATANAQRDQWKFTLNQLGQRNGVQFSTADLDWWANTYLPMGIQANDPRIMAEVARVYATRPDLHIGGSGDIAAIGDQLQQTAAQYFHPLSSADVNWWQQKIASGEASIQGFQAEMQRQAVTRWSMYSDQIATGITPEQLFAPQRNAIAKELEVDPGSIDLMSDPRWSQVLGVPDQTGKAVPMTYNQAIVLARGTDAWKNTAAGKSMSADFASQLTHTFGKVA